MLGSVWDDAGNISGEQSEGHSRLIPGEEISHRTAGNVGLGLSLEGLQGTAELSPWEGETGVLEICWTSPGKTSAQGQSMRLLGGVELLTGIRVLVWVVGPELPKTYP